LKPHANQRLHERSNFSEYNLTPSEVAEKINKNTITFIKKLTTSRSLGYASINGCHFKVIYSKTTGNVVTFLPITHDYDFVYEIDFGDKIIRMTVYPDCYHETKNSRVMTKFQEFNGTIWENLETKGVIFESTFAAAWTAWTTFINFYIRKEEK